MPSESWRENSPVIQKLTKSAFAFSFKQAVRVLERATAYTHANNKSFTIYPIAKFTPPALENIRFISRQSLSFPASDISRVKIRNSQVAKSQWSMQVNFMGLTGSNGTLPYHYSEFVLKRNREKDASSQDFFDLFNHRTISLFYQASIKYNLPIEYERHKLYTNSPYDADSHSKILLSLIGLGTQGLQNRLHTKDESLIFFSGLFSSKVRTVTGLQQIIQHHFSIPVEIKQFIGQWQNLIDDVRTRLPGFESPRGQNNQLGRTVMLGSKGWFSQGKFRIILGPFKHSQLQAFAPGTNTLKALDEIVKLYINFEHDYDYVMRIHSEDIPDSIQLNKNSPPIMGWNTWLSHSNKSQKGRPNTLDIPVSAQRLR